MNTDRYNLCISLQKNTLEIALCNLSSKDQQISGQWSLVNFIDNQAFSISIISDFLNNLSISCQQVNKFIIKINDYIFKYKSFEEGLKDIQNECQHVFKSEQLFIPQLKDNHLQITPLEEIYSYSLDTCIGINYSGLTYLGSKLIDFGFILDISKNKSLIIPISGQNLNLKKDEHISVPIGLESPIKFILDEKQTLQIHSFDLKIIDICILLDLYHNYDNSNERTSLKEQALAKITEALAKDPGHFTMIEAYTYARELYRCVTQFYLNHLNIVSKKLKVRSKKRLKGLVLGQGQHALGKVIFKVFGLNEENILVSDVSQEEQHWSQISDTYGLLIKSLEQELEAKLVISHPSAQS